MTDDDFDAFSKAWSGAWELAGKPITATAILLAFQTLRGYEFAEVTQALTRHALNPDTGQYPPKPADIVRALEGGSEGRAGLAWTKAVNAVRLIGGYDSVVFDCQVTQAVIADMGGWAAFCATLMSQSDFGLNEKTNFPFVQRDFERRFRAYVEAPGSLSHPAVLLGRIDEHNARFGHKPSHVKLIGNAVQARAVMQSATRQAEIATDAMKPLQQLLAKGAKQ